MMRKPHDPSAIEIEHPYMRGAKRLEGLNCGAVMGRTPFGSRYSMQWRLSFIGTRTGVADFKRNPGFFMSFQIGAGDAS